MHVLYISDKKLKLLGMNLTKTAWVRCKLIGLLSLISFCRFGFCVAQKNTLAVLNWNWWLMNNGAATTSILCIALRPFLITGQHVNKEIMQLTGVSSVVLGLWSHRKNTIYSGLPSIRTQK